MCEHFSVESLFPELHQLIRPEHLFAGYYDVTVTFDLLDAKCHWFIFFSLLNFHLQLFVALFIWFVGQRCFTWGHSHLRHLYQMCVLSVRHIWVKTANKSLANDVNEPWSQTIDYTCVMFVFRVWADSVKVCFSGIITHLVWDQSSYCHSANQTAGTSTDLYGRALWNLSEDHDAAVLIGSHLFPLLIHLDQWQRWRSEWQKEEFSF